MKFKDIVVRSIRKVYRTISQKKFFPPSSIVDRQKSNDLIYKLLVSDSPCMIARLGTTETITVNNYLSIRNPRSNFIKVFNYIIDNTHTPWWFEDNLKFLNVYSGVFPPTIETAERFSKLYIRDITEIDLLGSFQYYEKFMPFSSGCKFVHLEALYPFFVDRPWTKALVGKKVLVVHPFDKTISEQYLKRKYLFENEDVLPEYSLITLKAIQSAAGLSVPFRNWFEALDHMKKEIVKIDFDICILGCGAYGLPLAAEIKRMGKKAIHLGGGTQLLFGIKGKRWDNSDYGKQYSNIPGLMNAPYNSLYNEYWIKPLKVDTPESAQKIDGACYW